MVTWSVAVFTAASALRAASATQSKPYPTARPVGSEPATKVLTTSSVAELTSDSDPVIVLATHTSGPTTATAPAPVPTTIVASTESVSRSTR